MTCLEIDKAMCDIQLTLYEECQARLDGVPAEKKGERKALIIEREMYGLCRRAGLLWNVKGTRENVLTTRQRIIGQILQKYPVLCEVFARLDEEEKRIFMSALQAEIYMRDQIVNGYYAEYEAAKGSGDEKSIFELRIKIGGCENMFDAWEVWRVENHVYPGMFTEGLR